MAVDRVTLEVLRNYYQAIVEDMARIMERTAYTTFVKETADFSTGLVSTGGEYVAYPWNLGASSYLGMNMRSTLEYFDHYDEGDIVICNDAYLSGPLCTHLPDVHILRPIFHGGRIICWGYAFVHSSDMGGAVPASVWPRATEIFQEGLRLRPTKLYRAGVLQEDVKTLIGDNCRIPDTNWGDIKAMVAAVSSCDRRVQELVRKFGLATVVEGIDAVLDYAEQRARAAIRKIPDGTYRVTEYMEDDLRSDVPIRLQVALTAEGDSIHLDFTGTDPQVGSALNIASHGVTHPFLCQAINAYIVSEDPGIPKASSILRPVRVTAPSGSVVNARFPAQIGVRYATVLRVFDAVLGALAQALPGRVPAAPAGAISPVVASILDPLTGQRQVQVVEPMLGGGGGRPTMDGLGGADSTSGFLRNTPVESIEAEVPIVMRRYHLIPDTGGAGEHRHARESQHQAGRDTQRGPRATAPPPHQQHHHAGRDPLHRQRHRPVAGREQGSDDGMAAPRHPDRFGSAAPCGNREQAQACGEIPDARHRHRRQRLHREPHEEVRRSPDQVDRREREQDPAAGNGR